MVLRTLLSMLLVTLLLLQGITPVLAASNVLAQPSEAAVPCHGQTVDAAADHHATPAPAHPCADQCACAMPCFASALPVPVMPAVSAPDAMRQPLAHVRQVLQSPFEPPFRPPIALLR